MSTMQRNIFLHIVLLCCLCNCNKIDDNNADWEKSFLVQLKNDLSTVDHTADDNNAVDVKHVFSSFGAKRGFSPWGGKRATDISEIQQLENAMGTDLKREFDPLSGKISQSLEDPEGSKILELESEFKRSFNPWGRRGAYDFVNADDKRGFTPWAGKRSGQQLANTFTKEEVDKRGFSPWGGKRSENTDTFDLELSPPDTESDLTLDSDFVKRIFGPRNREKIGTKRVFNPWRGKRLFNGLDDKRAFNPWSGKRAFNPWSGKRAFNPWSGKRAFNPWSGKRAFNPWSGKRAFTPWGGKRSFSPWNGKRSASSL